MLKSLAGNGPACRRADRAPATAPGAGKAKERRRRRQGHGRNGPQAYPGREHGDGGAPLAASRASRARSAERGKVYPRRSRACWCGSPARPPLGATIYRTAEAALQPVRPGVHRRSARGRGRRRSTTRRRRSMIALLKYGSGVPFYRLERLQESLGIPLPASTQWDIVQPRRERHRARASRS